jgi:hypothetical protein
MAQQAPVERLEEFVSNRGLKPSVDRATGVLKGVKILGLQSRNNRRYLPEAVAKAAPLYEGIKVNLNHARESRSYQDRLGVLRNVAVRDDGLFADFHFNVKHPIAEQLLWDAEHAPENVGFSHVVEAKKRRERDGSTTIEEIVHVESVDLVADPATTKGLFEDVMERNISVELKELTIEQLQEHRPDLVAKLQGTDEAGKLSVETNTLKENVAALTKERDELKAKEAEQAKKAAIAEELKTAKLSIDDKKIVSEAFMAQLVSAPDAASRKVLIDDRKALLPQPRQVHSGAPPMAPIKESADASNGGHSITRQETLAAI